MARLARSGGGVTTSNERCPRRTAVAAERRWRGDGPSALPCQGHRGAEALLDGTRRPADRVGRLGAGIRLPGVMLLFTTGESTGGSDGSVVNHVAFRVPSFAGVEAAGLSVQRLQ